MTYVQKSGYALDVAHERRSVERIRLTRIPRASSKTMLRVPENNLDCVIYLYRTAMDAKRGSYAGGSGFLAAVESKRTKNLWWVYAVTNAHVIRENYRIVRVNTKGGASHYVTPNQKDNWFCSKTDDLAILNVSLPDPFKYYAVLETTFLKDDSTFSPGDGVMMLGRFVGYDGIQQNRPVVRSGILSMMPAVEIEKRDRTKQLSYLVECQSISGFSGSPVFVYRQNSPFGPPIIDETGRQVEYQWWLLGVDWCHLTIDEKVYDEVTRDDWRETNYRVGTNSGIAGVVPVSRLQDLLYQPTLCKMREEEEMKYERKAVNPRAPVEDFAKEPTQRTLAPKEKDRIEIRIPTKGEVMDVFKKATRKREKK